MEWKNFWTSDWVDQLHWMGMVHPGLDTSGVLGLAPLGLDWNSWAKMVYSNDNEPPLVYHWWQFDGPRVRS